MSNFRLNAESLNEFIVRFICDAKITQIYEGASEIQKDCDFQEYFKRLKKVS